MNLNTFYKKTLIQRIVGVAISINLHIFSIIDADSYVKHLAYTDYWHFYVNSQAVPIFL